LKPGPFSDFYVRYGVSGSLKGHTIDHDELQKTKARHAFVNIGFTAIHFGVHTLLAVVILLIVDWTKANQFGLVCWTNAGPLHYRHLCFGWIFSEDGWYASLNIRFRCFGVFISSIMLIIMLM
jgi:hypothetical protein